MPVATGQGVGVLAPRGKPLWGLDGPFFRPLWRRIAIVGFCLIWALVELVNGATFWAILFGGIGLVCAWQVFWVNDYSDPPAGSDAGEAE